MAPPDYREHGLWYVAARAADHQPASPSAARECFRCGEPVWVDEAELALADACTAIVCSICTGTTHGILYISPSASD